jgi:hypothetical protein
LTLLRSLRDRFGAFLMLKVMHIVHHIEARELVPAAAPRVVGRAQAAHKAHVPEREPDEGGPILSWQVVAEDPIEAELAVVLHEPASSAVRPK